MNSIERKSTGQTTGQTWWHVWQVAKSARTVKECPCLQFVHVDGVVLVFVKAFYQLLDLSASLSSQLFKTHGVGSARYLMGDI